MANAKDRLIVKLDPFCDIATDAYQASTSYVDSNYRTQWNNSIRAFHGQHPLGSKYYHPSYKYRSKMYRPKTRAGLRRNEAAGAAAFFGNVDLVKVDPVNENNKKQVTSAQINHWLLNYRLEKTIPWFQIAIGALQDAQTVGTVCSYNYWDHRKRASDGKVLYDRPWIDLRPIENIRIDPSANWLAPVESSPYFIDLIPMYAADVIQMMKMIDPKTGQPRWKPYTEAQIIATQSNDYDSTRETRERGASGARQDPATQREHLKHFDIVWVHRNIYRHHGDDMVWYTLGTSLLLSEPKYLDEVYFHGERPYTMGSYILETHRIFSTSLPELTKDLQKEANEIANSRMDNVKLAINKRYFVKRGREVDLASLVRNAAGSVSMMTDPEGDVKVVETPDVTGSSYAEQDRINLDFDDLAGAFSPSSIQSNRRLNETVGGLQILKGDSGSMVGYGLKTLVESWMEPTLRQVIKLEQKYETDLTILSLAADKAGAYERFGVNADLDDLLNQELTTKVNVGMTATDPGTRLQQLIAVTQSFVEIAAQNPGMDLKVLADEMYGKIGYRNSEKFWPKDTNPEAAKMQETIQQLQAELERVTKTKELDNQGRMQIAQIKEQGDNQRKTAELEQQDKNNKRDNEARILIARLAKEASAAAEAEKTKQARHQAMIDSLNQADVETPAETKAEGGKEEPGEIAPSRKGEVAKLSESMDKIHATLEQMGQREEANAQAREKILSQIEKINTETD